MEDQDKTIAWEKEEVGRNDGEGETTVLSNSSASFSR